jgi:large subunit ribosomal protein L10
MSKPVKNLITDSYKSRFEGITGGVLVDIRGIAANANNEMRAGLAEKQIKVTVIKNSLAKRAFEGTDLEAFNELIDGSNAVVYPVSEETSVVNVARELIDWAKKVQNMQFKGALLDGIQFGADEIKKLSEFPTKEEAQAKAIQILLTPGQKLAGSILGPGRKLASIIKAIEEKLESGEQIKKVA